MAFVAGFVAHAPDADPQEHRCVIETPSYRLRVAVVKDQEQAVAVCKRLVEDEGVQSFILCPGFSHRDVAEIAGAVGEGVGVNVARGDPAANRVAAQIIAREWSRG